MIHLEPEELTDLLEILSFADGAVEDYTILNEDEYKELLESDDPYENEYFYHSHIFYLTEKYQDLLATKLENLVPPKGE